MPDSFRGKQLPAEVVELVVRLKKHFDGERGAARSISTRNPAGRTAAAMGLGVATVKRIMSKHACGMLIPKLTKRTGRPPEVQPHLQPVVRGFIRERNLRGERVSVSQVKDHVLATSGVAIPKTTLWRALSRWGFTFGEGRRRDSLKEQDYVISARRAYLRRKRANRKSDGTIIRPEVYLDETFINKNHSQRLTWYSDDDGPWVNKPSGVGRRLIVVHAMTRHGWVEGAELVFEAKKRTGDYHGQMNWSNFSTWFEGQLLPNIPAKSLIILDNAPYHNVLQDGVFPGKGGDKEQLRSWLTRNGYPWGKDMLKSELLKLCMRYAPLPEFRLDLIARKHGHEVVRTPPYHPELQPIEICWAVVKNHMANNCDFTMQGLRSKLPEAFGKVTPSACESIMRDIFKQEDRYWLEDEKLDSAFAFDAEEAIREGWADQDDDGCAEEEV